MKTLFALLLPFTLIVVLIGCGSDRDTLATVGNDRITRQEFHSRLRDAFGPQVPPDSVPKETRRQFLDGMIRARVELLEAKQKGLTSDSSILHDTQAYRLSLARAQVLEKELIEPRLKDLYNRKLEEIRVAQIFLRLPEHPTPAETLEVYGRALHLVPFIPIVGFDALARQYSEDTLTGRRGGDAGWITGGMMEEAFERAAYSLSEGQYTKSPVRTSLGYHLIFILKRQAARGAVHVSHIVRHFAPNLSDTSAVRDSIWMVYERIKHGGDFAELARQFSDEAVTKRKGGDMGYFERDDLRPELSRLLYGLPVDSVTLPQRSRYVYQIYKVTGYKGIPSFEEMQNSLRSDYEQLYYQNDYIQYIQNLRRAERVTVMMLTWDRLRSALDGNKSPNDRTWDASVDPGLRRSILLTCSGSNVTVNDLLDFLRGSLEFRMVLLTPENLDLILARFTEKLVIDARARTIPTESPEFRRMVDEYENSLLIQRLEKEEVLDKVAVDDAAVRALFDTTREQYRWPDRVNFAEIYVASDTARKAVNEELARKDDFLVVAQRHTLRTGYSAKRGIWGLEPDTANPLARLAASLPIDSVTDFFPYQNGLTRIKTLAKEPSRLKTFDEVRPEVETTCRDLTTRKRMTEWLDSLKRKYGVAVNEVALGPRLP